jgi:hypothetical protein
VPGDENNGPIIRGMNEEERQKHAWEGVWLECGRQVYWFGIYSTGMRTYWYIPVYAALDPKIIVMMICQLQAVG